MTADGDGPTGRDALAALPSVQRWLSSGGYDSAPAAERRRLLDLLGDLCTYAGMQPEELVASCVRTTKAGDRAISAKGRRAVQETIDRFVAERGLAGHQAIVAGNTLRGFLIHNGIFMQGPASIR